MQRRHIFASRDTYNKMKLAKKDSVEVYSFFPVDPHTCVCQEHIEVLKERFGLMNDGDREAEIAKMGHFECPRDKTGMKRYQIKCHNCGQVQGYLWATDNTLRDWCDFHYSQWTDGNEWFGCLTPNISPIDGQLGLECTCGADSRDFRANMTLPAIQAQKMEDSNKQGRVFGSKGAKFTATPIRSNIKPRYDLGDLKSIKVNR